MRKGLWLLGGLVGLVLIYLGSMGVVAWDWSRRAHAWRPEMLPPDEETEQVWLMTADGQKLGAWLEAGQATRSIVVLLHGKEGSRSTLWSKNRYQHLTREGVGVLAVSMRSYGDSTGDRRDFQGFPRDVVAAVDFLERRFPHRAIKIMGPSLGAGAALMAAPQLGTRCAGYLLEVPYKDLAISERHHFESLLPPPLATLAYEGLALWAPLFVPGGLSAINPYEAAGHIPASVPVVLISGDADVQAQLWEAQAILHQVEGHGKLVVIRGADHHHCLETDPELYWKTVDDWALH